MLSREIAGMAVSLWAIQAPRGSSVQNQANTNEIRRLENRALTI